MALSKHETERDRQMFETFKQFTDLYRSKVELTGEKIHRLDPYRLPMDPSQPITYSEIDEVAIKMPRDEYERFLNNWNQYIDLMYVAKYNTMIGEEYKKLQMLVQLLR